MINRISVIKSTYNLLFLHFLFLLTCLQPEGHLLYLFQNPGAIHSSGTHQLIMKSIIIQYKQPLGLMTHLELLESTGLIGEYQ